MKVKDQKKEEMEEIYALIEKIRKISRHDLTPENYRLVLACRAFNKSYYG